MSHYSYTERMMRSHSYTPRISPIVAIAAQNYPEMDRSVDELSLPPSCEVNVFSSHELSASPSCELSVFPSHELSASPSCELSVFASHEISMPSSS